MRKNINKYNFFYKVLISSILIAIPLFPKFPSIGIVGSQVSVRLEDFLIFLVLVVFFVPMINFYRQLAKNRIVISIILFVFVGLISLFSAVFLTQSVELKIGFLHWFRRIEYLSLFFLGYFYAKKFADKYFFQYILKILLVVNLILFIYALGQRYFDFPVIITQNEEYSKGVALRWTPGAHINSTFAGHYDLASYLVLTLPIFVSSFFVFKDKISKLVLAGSALCGLWLLTVAVSRISILAFMISMTVSLYLIKKYKELLMVLVISGLIFSFSPDLQVRYKRIFDVLKERISLTTIVNASEDGNINEDRSTSIRLNVEWPRAIRAFNKNPLLGTGYSSITLATDNDYLRALGETGLLGLFSFLLIFATLFKKLISFRFLDNLGYLFRSSMIGSLIGILITAVFIDIFEASKFAINFWLMVGLVIGANKNE